MQVTETLCRGAEARISGGPAATELEERLTNELASLKDRVQLKGFRPGKVPVAHLRKVYGRSVMADVRAERRQRGQPQDRRRQQPQARHRAAGRVPGDKDVVERGDRRQSGPRLHGRPRGAAEFRAGRSLRRQAEEAGRDVPTTEVDEAIERMASRAARYQPKARAPRPRPATASPSISSAASTARSSRAARARTSASNSARARFIPGFEEQLVGAKAGDERRSSR